MRAAFTRGLRHLLTVPSVDRFSGGLSAPSNVGFGRGKGLIGYINSAAISPVTIWIATISGKTAGHLVWDTRTRERVQTSARAAAL